MEGVIDLLTNCKVKGINVSIDASGENIRMNGNIGNLTEPEIKELKRNKADILSFLKKTGQSIPSDLPVQPERPCYPLSSSQRRMWILSQLDGGDIAFNIPMVKVLEGDLKRECLELSFKSLIARHESLRTLFREDERGDIKQFILPPEAICFKLAYIDLRGEHACRERVEKSVGDMALTSFDLAVGPLLSAGLYHVEDSKWIFSCVLHHIVSDGWSMEVMIRELLDFYQAFRNGNTAALLPLRIQYKDYAVWQQEQLSGNGLQTHRSYWLDQLKGSILLELPPDKARPAIKTYNGGVVNIEINPRISRGIRTLVSSREATSFAGLLAAVNALLCRYCKQNEIIIGIPVAGRERLELEDQIGLYVNMLAIRTICKDHDAYSDLLARVKQTVYEAYDHQAYPFDELVEELDLPRDRSRNALFDVMVIWSHASEDSLPEEYSGVKLSDYEGPDATVSKMDLTFRFTERKESISLDIEYNSDLYYRGTIERLGHHFSQLLDEMTRQPEVCFRQLDYLSEKEKRELTTLFNATYKEYDDRKTLVNLFEERVNKEAGKIALVSGAKELTYMRLNERANRLGYYLRQRYDVGPDDLIGIKLERNEWMIIAILGILKSGAAYVPIDPSYPPDRIGYMLDDSRCRVVIDEGELAQFESVEDQYAGINPRPVNRATDLAYVIYTSGSTGRPKGVMIEHRSVVSFLENFESSFYLKGDMNFGAITSYTFDISVLELLGTLIRGLKLFLIAETEPVKILDYIGEQQIQALQITPSRLGQLMESIPGEQDRLSGLAVLLIGGEALGQSMYERLKGWSGIEAINVYGPTETTIWSSSLPIRDSRSLSIGSPLANETIFITDDRGKLCPVGVNGEIYIGGEGLARGYLNKPALTAEKFVRNPFRAGGRLYRTGDLGRWLPDGRIEFSGRVDDQVKIRGYRIETGEIENVLLEYEGMEAAVVLSRSDSRGEKELVAYLVSGQTLDMRHVKAFIGKTLPAYMLPGSYVQLEKLPLMVNGKLDRKSLPDPGDTGSEAAAGYVGPRNDIEEKLVLIWQEVLGKRQVGVKDNFFEIGGHSLKATRLSSQIHKAFEVKIGIKDLFRHAVLEEQGELISRADRTSFLSIPKAPVQEYYPLSSAQKRLFFLQEFAPESTAYNMPMINYLGVVTDKERLSKVFRQLIERHESCRTSFEKMDGVAFQKIHQEVSFELEEAACLAGELEDYLSKYVRPFDLSKAPLLRAAIVEVRDMGYVLIVDTHHIISDGTSHQVLMDDFLQFYRGEEIPELRLQYKDFSCWQNQMLESDGFNHQKKYWLEQFSGGIPRINFPASRPRPAVFTFKGSHHTFAFDREWTTAIKEFGKRNRATLQMTLLAVLNTVLYKYTGQESSIVGTGIAGRRHSDLDGIVGMFVNSLAIRSYAGSNMRFAELYKEIIRTCIAAYENQDIQFEYLVEMLKVDRDPSYNPIFDIALVVQNFDESKADKSVLLQGSADIGAESLPRWKSSGTARFDMTWFVAEENDGIVIDLEYYSAIYDEVSIQALAGHFRKVLQMVLENPDILLSEISLLTEAEEQQLLRDFVSGEERSYPDRTLPALFEKQCLLTPSAMAIRDGEGFYTYAELSWRSNQLGRFLKEGLGLTPESRVGVLQSRSKDLIVSIMGILKAGGAYVPLDSDYPQERLLYMLQDAGVEILVTEKNLIELANRLVWRSGAVKSLVCADSEDIYAERGVLKNDLMRKDLWDHIGDVAKDDISGGGWRSSYTGEDMSSEEMKEYSQNAYLKLAKYLRKDMRVLEIGCSSGLTMFQLAPLVKEYLGTDLSSTILSNTGRAAREKGIGNIKLACVPAHEIHLLDDSAFDLVIINSVIQCFDGHNYFRDVVVKAIGKMKDQGLIFLGDIMDEDKREELAADLENFKKAHQEKGFKTNTDLSTKLFLSRNYLLDLAEDNMGVAGADFSEKIHTLPNELTKYRYDALLHIDTRASVEKANNPDGVVNIPVNDRDTRRHKHFFDQRQINQFRSSPSAAVISGNSLAYVIYTSGSTGQPKGVMTEHRSAVNLLMSQIREFEINSEERVLQLANICFDASVEQIFLALISGSCLYMIEKETILEPEKLEEFLLENRITHLHTVPNILKTLTARKYPGLRRVLSGGDKCPKELAASWGRYHRFYNKYGPTETTVTSAELLYGKDYARLPIGRPIDNTQIYLLDDKERLTPVGFAGQIFIGGAGLARGYLNLPALTAEKFIDNPFRPQERIYRSGDLGRWAADGTIEFIGRIDDQVKIRGHRIEPGEIEAVVEKYPGIGKAVVIARSGADGESELVAYLVSREDLDVADLKEFLNRFLPYYMVPGHFVRIQELPLNANGKLDRKRLPDPAGAELSTGADYVAPRNEIEEKLVSIWQEILVREGIGVKDHFFEIGGHSLKATRLSSRIHKVFDVKIALKDLFTYTRLEEQAQLIAQAGKTSFITIPAAAWRKGYPLSSSQRRLWIQSQWEGGNSAYNIPRVYVLEGQLDVGALQDAFAGLIERHESLRTVFKEDEDGEVRQVIHLPEESGFRIVYQDVRAEKEQESLIRTLVRGQSLQAFDLARGPLLRAALYQLEEKKWVFSYVVHHIISDGWSMNIFIRELLSLYNTSVKDGPYPLSPLKIQYKDFAVWQQEQLKGGLLEIHKNYWLKIFEGDVPIIQLPGDRVRPALKTYNGGMVYRLMKEQMTQEFLSLSQEHDSTLFMGLAAAVNVLLFRYSGQNDIIIGTPIAGREHADLEDQIGFYLNTLPLRTVFSGEDSFMALLSTVREVTLGAYEHQAYPFDELVDQLASGRDRSRNPLFDVMVVLQNNESDGRKELQTGDNLKVSGYGSGELPTSKVDLFFSFTETEEGIHMGIQYNSDIYDKATVEQMADHLLRLISIITVHRYTAIQELDYLSPEEKRRLSADLNAAPERGWEDQTIIDLFEEQVRKTPGHIALLFEGREFSYEELNKRSNRLADYLRRVHNIKGDDLIGIKSERNEWLIIAILGVLKSGGAYVPIDPEYPKERVDYMMADSGCTLLLDGIELNSFAGEQHNYRSEDVEKSSHCSNLAYVIYTSGSTGQPKGVLITHGNLYHFMSHVVCSYPAKGLAIQPFLASCSFDISLFQLFTPLLSGGTCLLMGSRQMQDMDQFTQILKKATFIDTVPGVYNLLADYIQDNNLSGAFGHIERVFIGGDSIPDMLLRRLSGIFPFAAITVTYGPTEGTIFCTHKTYGPGEIGTAIKGSVIGWPVSGSQIYILDVRQRQVPAGVIGEICLGGGGLARGYLNREQLSLEKFVSNPFKDGEKMYRSGDLGRWLPDGSIQFTGRADDQIKIRGYRIEPEEIGKCLQAYEGIEQAIVIASAVKEQDKSLIGYFVRKQPIQVWPSLSEYIGYDELAYYIMNADEVQAAVYQKAIYDSAGGKIVLNIGVGPEAILARQCIAAGAKKVYAVEAGEEAYQKAKDKIESVGLGDRIIVIAGSILEIELPEKADCCILASVGNIGSAAGCIPLMNKAREFLTEAGCMIPYRSVTKIAAMNLTGDHVDYQFTDSGAYYAGRIFGSTGQPFDLRIGLQHVREDHLVSSTDIFEDLDLTDILPLAEDREIELSIIKDSLMTGCVVWLNLYAAPDVINDIFQNQTSYLPVYFPLFDPGIRVGKGDRILAKVWRSVVEGSIFPDYGIRGRLQRVNGENIPFSFISKRLPGVYAHNGFYRQLFPNGVIQVKEPWSVRNLQEYLRSKLPEYMVPSILMELKSIPLTPNGKVDRKVLPGIADAYSGNEMVYVGPRSEIEKRLVSIWQEILGKERIGVKDNFFDLGGHSLKAVRLVMRIKKEFMVKIDLKAVFADPIIEVLADKIENDTWFQASLTEKEESFDEFKL